MPSRRPALIAINHDDYHAEFVGRTRDGRQFFLTTPFEPAVHGEGGREFVALFLFDANGTFAEAKIEDLGPRDQMDPAKRKAVHDQWIAGLIAPSFERIEVAPFSLERFGTTFGLIYREPEDDDDLGAVHLMPGDFMAFYPPWDSGEYDT